MAYPYLSDVFRDVFKVNIFLPLPLPMFGIFVGLAFYIAVRILKIEVQRKQNLGVALCDDTSSKVPLLESIDSFAILAMVSGMLGARFFHILEYPSQFMNDPWGMIFSRGGFTVLGGMLVGGIATTIFLKKRGIKIAPFADAIAPALMLAYAVGRIGCQVAGDGDWGIAADLSMKPDWLPTWFWAQTYVNNAVGVSIPLPGVYPTPLYESVMALILFVGLWIVRKHSNHSGWLFFMYMFMSGVERFIIEKIRVNSKFDIMGIQLTQAEIISIFMISIGIIGMIKFSKLHSKPKKVLFVIGLGALAFGCQKIL